MPRDPYYATGDGYMPADSAATNAVQNSNFQYNSGNPLAVDTTASPFRAVDPNAPQQFVGPIPVGSTRTDTGYVTADGTVVNPQAPYRYDPLTGDYVPTNPVSTTPASSTTTTTSAGMTPEQIQALINAGIQQGMQQIQQQMNQQLAQQQAAAAQAKKDAENALRKSAFEITKERFANAGMKELGDEITAIYQGKGKDRFGKAFDEIPTSAEGFYLALINTKSYYDRFGKVNEDRLAAGYKALDEKTIIGLEDEYQKTLQKYNAPAGFYDQSADFQTFLKHNYSVKDVADTMQAYSDFVKSTNPEARQQLKDLYGIKDSDLTAYFADPTKGQSILENIAGKNMNTAAALIEGLTKEQADMAQQYGAGDLSYGQQRQAYSKVQKELQTTGELAKIYGENFGAKEAIAAEFGGDVAAQTQAARVRAINAAQFSGSSAIGRSALGPRTTGIQ